MRVGVLIPSRDLFARGGKPPDPGLALAYAEAAEALGLDSVWLGDSLTSRPRLEPLAFLAAVAARTSRVRVGTAVLLPALRPPLPLAHTVGTVDYVSRGRLVLAMGVGGANQPDLMEEWKAAGVPPKQRASRLEETIEILRKLWTGRPVSHNGRYFQFGPVTVRPLPWNGHVPLLLGCHARTDSERQLRRAARLADGIISIGATPDQYRTIRERVWQYAREEGRDPTPFEAAYYVTVTLGADAASAEAEGHEFLRQYYNVDRWAAPLDFFLRPDAIAGKLQEYRQAGVDTLLVRFASYRPLEQLGLFAREVLPHLA
ncbi:MAG: LLM class flavin-dependent oxidoreductase [Chloroflexi bacterium]|nr:LLM class flavin-dependent oxidoreductase [Chloroflexota bacterium]